MQAFKSKMCGSFCIEFTDFMLKGRSLSNYTSLFSPNEYEKNDKIIIDNLDLHIVLVDYLQKTKKESKILKKQEIHDIFIKTNHIKLVFSMAWQMDILEI